MISISDFHTREILDLLIRLAQVESPSTDKAAVDRLGRLIAAELNQLGANVTVEAQEAAGDHIIGRWGDANRSDGFLLLCHMDTVHPVGTLSRQPLRESDGLLFGPGVYDMKAGIAIALTALRALKEANCLPDRPVTALFTSDEETGSETSRPLIEALARRAALVLCLEPALPDGSLKTARKGTGEIEITAYGVAAHAGADHEKGRNAIEELAHHILAVQRLTDYATGTTANVGLVSGGTRTNVVPERAVAQVDIRVAVPEEVERIVQWAAGLQPVLDGTRVTARVTLNRPPMPRDARMVATFAKAQAIAARLGLTLTEASTGGASDANFVAPLGVAVLDGLGAQGNGSHSEREHVRIASLPERAALLAAILSEW